MYRKSPKEKNAHFQNVTHLCKATTQSVSQL